MNVRRGETHIPLAVNSVLDCINSRATWQEVDAVYRGGVKHPITAALQTQLPRMPLRRLPGESVSPGNRCVTLLNQYAGWE